MDSQHERPRCPSLTGQGRAICKLGDGESPKGAESILEELEEEVRRLQELVCELLLANQELRSQLLRYPPTSQKT